MAFTSSAEAHSVPTVSGRKLPLTTVEKYLGIWHSPFHPPGKHARGEPVARSTPNSHKLQTDSGRAIGRPCPSQSFPRSAATDRYRGPNLLVARRTNAWAGMVGYLLGKGHLAEQVPEVLQDGTCSGTCAR
jgi:hypothetical protein